MASAREVANLLDERPDLEPAIEAVLAADPPWTFHDIDVDSGRFGELVANGVVERTGDGYRVVDPHAVTTALEGEAPTDEGSFEQLISDRNLPVSGPEAAAVAGALLFVVLLRLVAFPNVFVDGHVVLSGNDPYAYRYLVEQLLADPEVTPSNLDSGVALGEPLYVVTMWLIARSIGGTPAVAGHVLAWYPVVTAVLTALFIYVATVVVTDDRRVGLAAVAMLAVLPAHAFRTSLGFADHHPFDYLWLGLTVLGLVVLAHGARDDGPVLALPTTGGASILAIGIAGQALAWDNSPIILAALGPYIALEALRSVNADESPLRTIGPVLTGVLVASVAVWSVHDWLGWHTTLVASAPILVAIGGIGVVSVAVFCRQRNLPVIGLAFAEALIITVAAVALRALRPEYWSRLVTSIESRLLAPRPIAEVNSIFSEAGGWLLLFGFILLIAVPYLAWASYRAIDDARWLPLVCYGWYFFTLSTIQARFVGELSPVIAIFAGLAFVHLAERIDIARRPAPFTDQSPPSLTLPDARAVGYGAVLFILITGLSIVQVPVKTSQVSTPPELAETAFYLADHSDERNLEYPENYVFSVWDKNRVYNYFVSGESRSYGYAQSNFDNFLTSTDPPGWYDRLGGRAGYVVVTSRAEQTSPPQLGALLYEHHGSRTSRTPGLAHYRLIYVSDSGEYKAFELVEGAVLEGQAAPNETVEVAIIVDHLDKSFTYRRATMTDASGNYTVQVAHPGTYEVGEQTVRVSESDVRNGTVVTVPGG